MNPDYSVNYRCHLKKGVRPILFLHGFLGILEDWEGIIESIKDHYSYLTIDLPGHGKTANVNSMQEAAEAVIELLDELDLDKVYLYGYSMGGRLALYLSLHYTHRFISVILESASPGLKTAKERKNRITHDGILADKLEKEPLEQFLSFWYAQPLFKIMIKQSDFQRIYQRRIKNSGVSLAQSLRSLGTGKQPSLWGKLSENKLQIQLLVGEYDLKFVNIAQDMCLINKNIVYKVVEKSGHTIYIENQKVVLEAIEKNFIIDRRENESF